MLIQISKIKNIFASSSTLQAPSFIFKPVACGLQRAAGYFILFIFLSGCQNKQLYKDTQVMLGTFVEVTSPYKEAAGLVFAEIKRIENLLSKYKENSEISQLNKWGKLSVSPDTLYVIKKSKEFWLISEGAFDITVGPLMDLWGFSDKRYSKPSEEEIKNILRLIGSDKIILSDSNSMVEFKFLGMKIDLGAIAKGFALDCAAKKLKENNIKSCLINAGGQVYCLGDKPPHQRFWWWGKSGRAWRIAIKDPREKDFAGYLELKDKSVSTSGDYEQYFIQGKKRYTHILNPKTGYPVNSGVISVTVIAQDGLIADALSTSIFVLGKVKGTELAKRFPEVKVEIIEEKDVQNNR